MPDFIPQVTMSLWDRAGTTLVANLANTWAVEWQDPVNDVGFGKFTIAASDSDASLITRGQIVQCAIYGVDNVFAWRIESIERTRIVADEEVGQIIDVSGRGTAQRFHDSKVYPPLGVDQVPPVETRSQSFASPEYDSSSWDLATEMAAFGDLTVEWTGVIDGVLVPAPFGWPDLPWVPAWIWTDISETDAGICYFRRTFDLEVESPVEIIATGDNFYTLYLDGVALLGDNTFAECWNEHRHAQVTLIAGTHTLAAVVNNIRTSIAGFLCAVYIAGVDNPEPTLSTPPTMIVVSDASWSVLGYPANEPGFSPGRTIIQLINEAAARGQLTDIIANFDATHDSASVAWAEMPETGVTVGDSILDTLTAFTTGNWCDWHLATTQEMDGYTRISMWAAEGRGVETAAVFAADVDIVDITHSNAGRQANRLLVKYAEGLFVLDDAASQAALGVIIEEYLTLDAANRIEAERVATRRLAELTAEEPAITITLEPTGNDRPYVDWWPGDRVTAPAEDGTPTLYRVLGVVITQDDMGDPRISVELNRRVLNLEQYRANLFQTLGSGVIGKDPVSEIVPDYISDGD